VIAWEVRLGVPTEETPVIAPYAIQVAGPPQRAAEAWEALGMPYHAALALWGLRRPGPTCAKR
jgi:hypothetical protein